MSTKTYSISLNIGSWFYIGLTGAFVAFKLTGIIAWNWFLVFSPCLIALSLSILAFAVTGWLLSKAIKQKRLVFINPENKA